MRFFIGRKTLVPAIVCAAFFGVAGRAQSADPVGRYEEKTITYSGGGYLNEKFKYLLLSPERIDRGTGKKYPVILYLHGPEECGDDTKKLLVHFPPLMARLDYRSKHSCFVLVPQCREGQKWVDTELDQEQSQPREAEPTAAMKVAIEILKKSLNELPIDRRRIYLTGYSSGGYGCWDLVVRHSDWFAAVAPICGGGDESRANRLISVPIWAVHGEQDKIVPVARSRRMVAAIVRAGGNPKYTEYPNSVHQCWMRAYTNRDGVLPWMFKQSKVMEPDDFR